MRGLGRRLSATWHQELVEICMAVQPLNLSSTSPAKN